ncbi:MAG: PAS domain-containing sensor histidine kinase [Planctomycetota bacterium]|jgi:PAS domain S-box-containing protein
MDAPAPTTARTLPWAILGSALLMLGVLVADLMGVAGGVPYVAAVLVSLWAPRRGYVLVTAAVCSVLTILGLVFSPPGGAVWTVIANRMLALFAIWFTATLGLRFRQAAESLRRGQADLEEGIRLRTRDLSEANASLRVEVAERRRAERALERMSKVFMEAADPIVVEDLNGRIVDLNRETERLYGWTREELLGQPFRTLVPPQRHRQAHEALERCRRGESVRNEESLRCSRSGVVYPVLVTKSLLTSDAGEPLAVATISKHITALKRAQEEVRQSEERYRTLVSAILETAVEGILTIDEKGVIESINPAAQRMFGYTSEEAVGQSVNLLMPSPYRQEHDDYIARYLTTGETKIIGIGREATGLRKDGSDFPIDLSVSEVRVGDRRLFTGFVRDITERKQASEALRRERDFAEGLIETAQVIVLVLDPEGRIVRFNKYMEELSGYRLDEVRGKDWFETFLPAREWPRIREMFKNAVADHEVRGNINPIVTKGGVEREVAWWARTLKDVDGQTVGVLSVGHDVTELRRAQERLVQSERLAGIGQMITGLAHESRNALQRMQSCLELLAVELEDRAQALDYVARVQHAQDYLSQLFEEVRNYAAPIQLDRQVCDLRRLWGAAWADLEVARRGKDVRLVDQTDGVDLACNVDPFALGQVFRNIFDNAISAVDEKGRIAILCEDGSAAGEPVLSLIFSDSGPGLTPEQSERIFQPFFTTKTRGTGLGMAIVRRILEAHGGRVAVGSGPLSGAAIVVTLPRGGGR